MNNIKSDNTHSLLEKSVWGNENGVRAFLSHTAEHKAKAAEIKSGLRYKGISAFLAHEDIPPTDDWQEVIRYALDTMDFMIALLTEDFQQSEWTSQEIGYALGRGVPVISVNSGSSSYGFMSRYQDMKHLDNSSRLAQHIFELQFKLRFENNTISHRDQMEVFIQAVSRSLTYEISNHLATYLPRIYDLTDPQIEALVCAYNENRQVYESHGFEKDLAARLSELTGKKYTIQEKPRRITVE